MAKYRDHKEERMERIDHKNISIFIDKNNMIDDLFLKYGNRNTAIKIATSIIMLGRRKEDIDETINVIIELFKKCGLTQNDAINYLNSNYSLIDTDKSELVDRINSLIEVFNMNGLSSQELMSFITNCRVNRTVLLYKDITKIKNFVIKKFLSDGFSEEEAYQYLSDNRGLFLNSYNHILGSLSLYLSASLDNKVFYEYPDLLSNYYSNAQLYNAIMTLKNKKEDLSLGNIKNIMSNNKNAAFSLKDIYKKYLISRYEKTLDKNYERVL